MRYGHQPLNVLMELPFGDLVVLAEEIVGLVNDENESSKSGD